MGRVDAQLFGRTGVDRRWWPTLLRVPVDGSGIDHEHVRGVDAGTRAFWRDVRLRSTSRRDAPHTGPGEVHVPVGRWNDLVPQAPQCAGCVIRCVSQPSSADPLQLPNPALHEPAWQLPPEQGAAMSTLQARPQVPQLAGSVARCVSQPSLGDSLQSTKPDGQADPSAGVPPSSQEELPTQPSGTHTPAWHVSTGEHPPGSSPRASPAGGASCARRS